MYLLKVNTFFLTYELFIFRKTQSNSEHGPNFLDSLSRNIKKKFSIASFNKGIWKYEKDWLSVFTKKNVMENKFLHFLPLNINIDTQNVHDHMYKVMKKAYESIVKPSCYNSTQQKI